MPSCWPPGLGHLAAGDQWTSVDVARMDEPPTGVAGVVIDDQFGGYEVIGVAERLVEWGIDVTVVTPFEMLAPRMLRELVLIPAGERLERAPGAFR